MHSVTVLAFLSSYILLAFTYPSISFPRNLDPDFIYFPDQAEYVNHSMICPDNMFLWPGTRRCYREGEQGPCNIGRILVFDQKLLRPYCMDTIFK